MSKYIVTYAQNATPVHLPFWKALGQMAKAAGAELVVIPGRYRNPTSMWNENNEHDEWWADEVQPFLCRERKVLCKNLAIIGDISIQPTATRPLNGMEVFAGARSAIFGHAKRALEVVPTETRMPRAMWTSSACTVPNYTDSKSGKRSHEHHVIGAVVVEVAQDGKFFVRNITWDHKSGSFTDLDRRYAPGGATKAPRAATLTMGDLHAAKVSNHVGHATKALVKLVQPEYVVLHDVLDFEARNHHRRERRDRFELRFETVKAELDHTCDIVSRIAGWGDHKVVVVRSNHDEAFERWLDEAKPDENDPVNAPYFHQLWAEAYAEKQKIGSWPNMFEREARKRGLKRSKVRFLSRNDSFKVAGVEHGFHGDNGLGGSRGNALSYVKMGVKVTIGHTHVARIIDGVFVVGTSSDLDHGYNELPSCWTQSHVLEYADGKRTVIFMFDGRFRAAA